MAATLNTDIDRWLEGLARELQDKGGDERLFNVIVNAPFINRLDAASIFLGVVVLLQVNKKDQTIDRIAICNTEIADRTKDRSVKRFEDIRIPLGHPENAIAQVIETGKPQDVLDWKYLFVPEMNARDSRYNQADGGIAFSSVHPLTARDGGAMIFSYFQPRELMDEHYQEFMKRYVALVDARLAEPS